MLAAWMIAACLDAAAGAQPAPDSTPPQPLAIYTASIRPLLNERCVSCHGGLTQKAGLRLDTATLLIEGGESGGAITKGDPDRSLVIARVSDPDPATRMPPEGEGEPLSPEQIASLRAWIAAGAPAPRDEKPEADPRDHWAFRPPRRPEAPAAAAPGGSSNPIDAFLAAARAEAGLVARPEAPRHVLVRRLYIDLIGLPPQPEELAAHLADTSPGWYESLVDALLADPRHGERWARHWMDVWRYSDLWGLGDEHRNSQRHMWHFRDWIVESLNADVGYDEMVRSMLAADELYPDDLGTLRATGFLARNWFSFNRTPWLDQTVEHVGKGLLGLTVNCAKCHAHKYDPISQEDYYRLRAFFEPIQTRLDVVPGEPDLRKDGIPRVFDAALDAPTYRFIRGDDTRPDTSKTISPGVPDVLAFRDLVITPVALPTTAFRPERRPWVGDAHLAPVRRQAAEARARQEREPTPANEQSVAVAAAALLAVEKRVEAARAAWAAEDAGARADDDPLRVAAVAAARAAAGAEKDVAVARAWAAAAGVADKLAKATAAKKDVAGLVAIEKELAKAREGVEKAVKAAADPGTAFPPLVGAAWTPTRFRESRTDDPPVAFPASSTGRRTALAAWITDPRNPLAARVAVNHVWMRHLGRPLVATVFDFGRRGAAPTHPDLLDWLASEFVERGWSMKHLHRLICTSTAYRMDSSTRDAGGGLAADPDNRLLWRREPIRLEAQVVRDAILSLSGTLDATMGGPPVPADAQAASRRRSLYFWHSEVSRNRFLTTFDDATPKECYERERSIVPQQALALSNAALVHDAAARIAAQAQAAAGEGSTDDAFLDRAFATVLQRPPSAEERAACAEALARWRALGQRPAGAVDPARVHAVWALLNHNDFVTLR